MGDMTGSLEDLQLLDGSRDVRGLAPLSGEVRRAAVI